MKFVKFIPNALTILRILLLPVFVWTFFCLGPRIALFIFIAAALTDVLDGYIARKAHVESNFGKLADPLADKLMTITALVCLTIAKFLPWYFLAFFILKELFLIIGTTRTLLRKKIACPSKIFGKAAMVVVSVGIMLSFFSAQIHPWNIVIMFIAVGLSVAAAIDYYICYYQRKTETG